ncbi:MAG TPA: hypothetical protein VHE83_17605 [Mycobacteriales bacterium]|nr:hypothetical protein [Mycobacteriales bacterium]
MTTLLEPRTAAAAGPHAGPAVAAPRRGSARRIATRTALVVVVGTTLTWAVTTGGPDGGPRPVGVARLALGDVTASAYLVPRTDGRATLVVAGAPQVHLAVTVDGSPATLSTTGGVATTPVVDPTSPVTVGITTPDGHSASARIALPALPAAVRTDDADAWLGHALSGRATPATTTATQGSDDPELDGRGIVAGLRFRGVHSAAVLLPTSDRGTLLVRGITTAARTAGIRIDAVGAATEPTALRDDALVVTGERADAIAARAALAEVHRAPLYGVWLAPWLFDRAVLDSGADVPGEAPAPVVFTLPLDPFGTAAQAYLAAITKAAPGQPATYEGLVGWIAEHSSLAGARRWQLYVAGDAAFLPQSLDAGHDHGGPAPTWIGSGGVNAASTPLTVEDRS